MKKRQNILIAENECIVAKDIEYLLEDWGYNAFTMNNPKDSLEKYIKSKKFDAMIIDDDFSDVEKGLQTAVDIARQYRIGVILLSAWLNDEVNKKYEDLDFFYCLEKPYDRNELQVHVEALFNCLIN